MIHCLYLTKNNNFEIAIFKSEIRDMTHFRNFQTLTETSDVFDLKLKEYCNKNSTITAYY